MSTRNSQRIEVQYPVAASTTAKESIRSIAAPTGSIEGIHEFPNLESLNLEGNTTLRDFSFLSSLPRLERLDLSDMGLTSIPPEVKDLPELGCLMLNGNSVQDFTALAAIPKLAELGLKDLGLRKIPPEVLELSKLRVLGLRDNAISGLTGIAKLSDLEALYIGGTSIKKLPADLTKLKSLRILDIASAYQLTDRNVLAKLHDLEELWITNAHEIPALPKEIFALEKLRFLSIHVHWNAPADTLEGFEGIGLLTRLEELHIHGATIERLPDGFRELTQLRRLDLSDNKGLCDVSALADLPRLEELDLCKNDIVTLEASFSTLKALKKLSLNHNARLAEVPGLRDLPVLEELNLFSKLKSLPDALGSLTALKRLNLSSDGAGAGFLSALTQLEELYIAGCVIDEVPSALTELRHLTLYRPGGDDRDLARLPKLETLAVNQRSFTMPALPGLRSLSVCVERELNLDELGVATTLDEMSIHRSKMERLPASVALCHAHTLHLEFLEELQGLDPVCNMPGLRTLNIRFADRLSQLPPGLASNTGLTTLVIESCEALTDIAVVGEFLSLQRLELESVGLTELPSLAGLSKLAILRVSRCDDLASIHGLEALPSLTKFECTDCGNIKRQDIAKVSKVISSRNTPAEALKMSYDRFISTGAYRDFAAKEDAKRTYKFPLWFDAPETLLEEMESFGWLDDYRDDDSDESAILAGEGDLRVLAILDFSHDGCDTDQIDAYSEEVFLVNAEDDRNPVYIWGHDGPPQVIHESFDDFIASLRDFSVEGAGDEIRTYLEYIDAKSSKFWQIVVRGFSHEVTFGKVGSRGSSKTKEFESERECSTDAEKLIKSKLEKGYAKAVRD